MDYEMFKSIIVVVMAVIGVLMVVCPKKMQKKEYADDEHKMRQTRISGIVIVVLCVLFLIINTFMIKH